MNSSGAVLNKDVECLTFFAVRGDFFASIGEENSFCFKLCEPLTNGSVYILRVFDKSNHNNSGDISEFCQYIGFYTGALEKNISFLPNCEVVIISKFPLETPVDINQIDRVFLDAVNSAQPLCSSLDDKELSLLILKSLINLLQKECRQGLVDVIDDWCFFVNEKPDDYLITFSCDEVTNSQVVNSIMESDPWLNNNGALLSMVSSFRDNKSGAAIILYPRGKDASEIVGCAVIHPMVIRLKRATKIDVLISVWVCEELRRRGYGKKLVKKAASVCNNSLFSFFPLDDSDEMLGLLKFFKECGCKNSVVSTESIFGSRSIVSIKYDKMNRVLILDDLSSA